MNQQSNLPGHVAAESPKAIANATLSKGGVVEALVPQSLDDAFRLAKALASAGDMVPQHFQGKPEATMAAIVRGMEIGLAPMQSLSNIAVINGRACVWGDALPALMMRSGHHIDVRYEGEGDELKAVATLTRGDTGREVTRDFSIADAKQANLFSKKGPWQQYPKRMLSHRARSWAVRDGAADALMGLHIAEEVQDYQPMRNVTPQEPKAGGFAAMAQNARRDAQPEATTEPESSNDAPQEQEAPIDGEILPESEEETQSAASDEEASREWSFECDEGVTAFKAGKGASECPYQSEPEQGDWMRGWSEACEAANPQEGGAS